MHCLSQNKISILETLTKLRIGFKCKYEHLTHFSIEKKTNNMLKTLQYLCQASCGTVYTLTQRRKKTWSLRLTLLGIKLSRSSDNIVDVHKDFKHGLSASDEDERNILD